MAITKKFEAKDGLNVTGELTDDNLPISVLTVAASKPTGVAQGALWWDTETGKIYIYYEDGTSNQWVEVNVKSWPAPVIA